MSDLSKKIIQVSSVEMEEKRIKINDENKKLFTLWLTKQDGSPTKAYEQYQQINPPIGSYLEVAYDQKPNPNKEGTFYRTIKMMKLSTQEQHTQQPDKSNPQASQTQSDVMYALREIYKILSVINAKLGIDTEKTQKTPQNANTGQITPPVEPDTPAAEAMKQGMTDFQKEVTDLDKKPEIEGIPF